MKKARILIVIAAILLSLSMVSVAMAAAAKEEATRPFTAAEVAPIQPLNIIEASLLNESFNDTTFPPTGWGTTIITDVSSTGTPAWTRETAGTSPTISPHSGAAMSKFNSFSVGAGDGMRLYSKSLNLTGVTNPAIKFWMSHDTGYATAPYDRIKVQVSTDGGATYTTIGTVNRYDATCSTPCWQQHSFSLAAYLGQADVRIGFLAHSQYGNNMFLDDVMVEVDGADLSTSYKNAQARVKVDDPITYSVHIINSGNQATTNATMTDAIPAGTEYIPGSLSCSSGACGYVDASTTVTWTGTLAASAAVTVTFAVDTDLAPCGNIVNQAVISDTGLIGGEVIRQATTLVAYYLPVLEEGFDAATFPPTDWGTQDIVGTTTNAWTRQTTGSNPTISPRTGAGMARYNADIITTGNSTRLYSKVIDLSTLTKPMLTFWMSHDDLSNLNDRIQVQISTDGGATYTDVGTPIYRYDATIWIASWKQHMIDLSAYAGQSNVRIAFLGISALGNNIFLDDIWLADPWAPCPYISLGANQTEIECSGRDVPYDVIALNATPATQTITIGYDDGSWPLAAGPTTVELGPGEAETINPVVHIPGTAAHFSTDTFTMTATAGTYGDVFNGTTRADLIAGYSDKADVTTGRWTRNHSLVYYNGKLYKFGGYDGLAETYVNIYDIATNTWSAGTSMPLARYWIDCVEIGGKIYCAGGYSTSAQTTLYIYDPAGGPGGTWTTGAVLPTARYGYAGVAYNGKYYIMGGYSGSAYVNTLWAYDPATNTWDTTTLASMSAARRDGMAGVIGGKIYITGGRSASSTYVITTEVYDPALNTWSTVASLPPFPGSTTPVTGWVLGADGVLFDRYLVIVGGAQLDAAVSNTYNALAYDTVTNQWQWLPNYNHKIYGAEADGDGTSLWLASGRLHEGGLFQYSKYTTKLLVCGPADADLSCLKLDAEDPVTLGATITYTVYVTNTGVSDAWNTVVSDAIPAGTTFVSASPECVEALGIVTCDLGSLRSGLADSIEIVVNGPAAAGVITNTVSVTSDEADLNLANNSDLETTMLTNASIGLTKLACTDPMDPATCGASIDVLSGTTVYYQYVVQNTGVVTFSNHTLVDDQLGTIFAGVPYTLTPGATFSFTVSTVILTDTTNTATWTATDGVYTVDDDATATVDVVPATITFEKTVGTDPSVCATTASITVGAGTDVYYCYTVENTSPGGLITHTLADSELGLLLNNFVYNLEPGASAFITATVNITASVVNTATWTATDGVHTAIASDTASVTVVPVLPGCGVPLEDFNAGTAGFPPGGWAVVNNGGTKVWESSQTTGYANLTGGTGYFADANSDWATSSGSLNTELHTPYFSLAGAVSPVLVYRYDYRDIGGADTGSVDITTDGGATWTNLRLYTTNDRGPKLAIVDLSAFVGEPLVQVRFTYVDSGWDWYFGVDDVQVACSNAPDINATPSPLTKTLLVGQTGDALLNIANLGLSNLNWTATEGCGTPVAWMTITPTLGTALPLLNSSLTASFDATSLTQGTYNSSICLASNDPDEPNVNIPVVLTVEGQPVIGVTPDNLATTQMPDAITTQAITIANTGNIDLNWTIVEAFKRPVIPVVAFGPQTDMPRLPNSVKTETGIAGNAPAMSFASGGPAPEDIGAAWETMAPLPSARVFNAVIADKNGYVYVIGGTSDAAATIPTDTVFRYNTATNTWDTMSPVPVTLDSIDGITILNKIYIPGDDTTATTYVYDIATNTWSSIAANGGYTARSQYQVVAIGTDLYVLGGITASASTTQVWILDTTTGTWTPGVPMQKSRTSFSAAAIQGEIYVAGGVLFPGFTPDMTAEKFNGTVWSYVAGVPNGGGLYTRWSYNADGYGEDGLWLAAGRRDAGWAVLNHAGYYDPDTNTWTTSPTIPMLAQGRVYMEADVATDGYFYVIGGRNSAGDTAYATNERLQVGMPLCEPVDAPWLSVNPASGTVASGGNDVVSVSFDSTGMPAGTYHANMCIASDDPVNPLIAVPVTMTVELQAVPSWEKEIWINGELFHPGDSPFQVANGDTVTVVDEVMVTSNDPVTYTLEELFMGNVGLVDATADFGVVITGANSVSWEVSGGISGDWYTITKTFMVNADLGWHGHISETLAVVNGPNPIVIPLDFIVLATVDKDAPDQAYPGDVIPYTIEITTLDPLAGTALLTDTLPVGVEFAGGLTTTFGTAWYDDGSVYWEYADVVGRPNADVIQDGSFELGSPNPYWTELSLHTFALICDATCGVDLPNTGSWFVWMGGWGNEAEQASIDQDVTIPNGVATLSLWLLMGRQQPTDVGMMNIQIDGTPVFTVTEADIANYGTYAQIVVDVSAFADGGVHNVKIYEENPAGNAGNINFFVDDVVLDVATIPNPTTITITFNVTVTAVDGEVINTAEMDFNDVMMADEAQTEIIPVADLSIIKSDSADPVAVGETFTFTLAVENAGPSDATDITIEDVLPAGITFVSAAGCDEDAGVVTCNIATLANGATAMRYIVVQADTVGTITNTATVDAVTLDLDMTDNSDTETTEIFLAEADLSVTKTALPATVYTHDVVTYTIEVVNNGPDVAASVVVTDYIPVGSYYMTVSTTQGTCSGVGPVVCELGDLENGENAVITLVVWATDNPGTMTNTVEVTSATGDPDPLNNTDSVDTTVLARGYTLYLPIVNKNLEP